jgi:PHP family Zn ribbon phosphoesterase
MLLRDLGIKTHGVHCSNIVNIYMRAQKGYYLEQACTKCTYQRHIATKHEVDIHEAGDKAIENICKVRVYGFTRSSQT